MEKRGKKDKRSVRFFFWGCTVYGVLNLLGPLLAYVLAWLAAARSVSSHAATIGIIGGADGPTAIFITTPPWTACILPVLALAAGISGLIWLRRKQRADA